MSTVYNFDGYSEFADWCEQNGYDPDDLYDETEESHKRDTWQSFYVKNVEDDTYAEVSVLVSYDQGWLEGQIVRENLTRTVELVTTESVKYE